MQKCRNNVANVEMYKCRNGRNVEIIEIVEMWQKSRTVVEMQKCRNVVEMQKPCRNVEIMQK